VCFRVRGEMKCENCHELLSAFIDGELEPKNSARVRAHLALCLECAKVYEDFSGILGVCSEKRIEEVPIPNPQALWCRINNIIENEIKPEIDKETEGKQSEQSWTGRVWNRSWRFSFTQLASSVLGIALISSLLTVVSIRNAPLTSEFSIAANATAEFSLFEKVLSKIGVIQTPQQTRETQIRERQATIDYWNKRVQTRRAQWAKPLREVFDRNLSEIDQVVSEYTRTLQDNPQDELSGEMLDSTLSEKMELLREFSEL